MAPEHMASTREKCLHTAGKLMISVRRPLLFAQHEVDDEDEYQEF